MQLSPETTNSMPIQSNWTRIRTFVLDNEAVNAWDIYEVELLRFEEAWKALEWLLGRNPTIGVCREAGGNKYWLYKQDSDVFAMTPSIAAVYSFDDNHIYIHGIKAEEANRNWQGNA